MIHRLELALTPAVMQRALPLALSFALLRRMYALLFYVCTTTSYQVYRHLWIKDGKALSHSCRVSLLLLFTTIALSAWPPKALDSARDAFAVYAVSSEPSGCDRR